MPSGDRRPSALTTLDDSLGELLSWVAGRDVVRGRHGKVDAALGELLGWTGLVCSGRDAR